MDLGISQETSMKLTKKQLQKEVIKAAVIWAACPHSGSWEGHMAIEDTCEQLAETLRLLNKGNPISQDLTFDEAEELAKKLSR